MNKELADFLATGVLAGLPLGATFASVTELLGAAPARVNASKLTTILKYGPLEITIMNEQVTSIALSCLEDPSEFQPLPIKIAAPSATTTVYDFVEMLDDAGLDWTIGTKYTFDRQLCIVTRGGVWAYFDLDQRELQRLQTWSPQPQET